MNVRHVLALCLLGSPILADACSDLLNVEFRPLAKKEPVNLCREFDGKVLLVVNTASKCGFTPQYEGLEAMHQKYAEQGFAVVGFPSNDFMNQEPGNEQQIQEFCQLTYGVKFPMFEKVHVKQGEAAPFYAAMAAQAGGEYPKWNFHKYVIDRNGNVVKAFGSRTAPDNAELTALVEKLISEKAAAPAGSP